MKKNTILHGYLLVGMLIFFNNTWSKPDPKHDLGKFFRDLFILGGVASSTFVGWTFLAQKLYSNSLEYKNPQARLALQALALIAASPAASVGLHILANIFGIKIDEKSIIKAPVEYLVIKPIEKAVQYLNQKQSDISPEDPQK